MSDDLDTSPPAPKASSSAVMMMYLGAITLGIMPMFAGAVVYYIGGTAQSVPIVACGFLLCGLLTPTVIVRSKLFHSGLIATAVLVPLLQLFEDVPRGNAFLMMPLVFLANGSAVSALTNVLIVTLSRVWLSWTMPLAVSLLTLGLNVAAPDPVHVLVAAVVLAFAARFYRTMVVLRR